MMRKSDGIPAAIRAIHGVESLLTMKSKPIGRPASINITAEILIRICMLL